MFLDYSARNWIVVGSVRVVGAVAIAKMLASFGMVTLSASSSIRHFLHCILHPSSTCGCYHEKW